MSARDELLRLYERDGKLTAEQVLAEAVDPSSPLHRYFQWDDADAAHRWRLDQAERLIQRYRVTFEIEPERTVRPRLFTHVRSRDSYVPTQEAISAHRDEVFEACVADLSALRAKYEALVDLDAAWSSSRRRTRKKAS